VRTTILAAALVATGLVAGPAGPAGAANDQDPRVVERTIVYRCDAGPLGQGDVEVQTRVLLPRTAVVGTKLASRPIDLAVVLPEEMVQALREAGVEEVSGESEDATWSVGDAVRDIDDLVLPPTAVPAEGYLVVEGQGLARGVRLGRVDTYPVRMPAAFTATLTGTGQVEATVDVACALVEDQRAKLTSLRVVPRQD
jgi:hypothetical protein